jgi:isochorismate hydrolase
MTGLPSIAPYPLPTKDDLPPAAVPWLPDARRALLLVHDMQQYFLAPFPEPMRTELLDRTAQLRERCARLGIPVAYTAQPGRMSDVDRGLLRDFWGPGMRADKEDRAVVAELAPAPGDLVLTKWRYSAFFRSPLLERMREWGRDQILLCGVYAHVGIAATALDAFTHDIQPFLIADAVGDFTEEHHRQALSYTAENTGRVLLAEQVFA